MSDHIDCWIDPKGKVYPLGIKEHSDIALKIYQSLGFDGRANHDPYEAADQLVGMGYVKISLCLLPDVTIIPADIDRHTKRQQKAIVNRFIDFETPLPKEWREAG